MFYVRPFPCDSYQLLSPSSPPFFPLSHLLPLPLLNPKLAIDIPQAQAAALGNEGHEAGADVADLVVGV